MRAAVAPTTKFEDTLYRRCMSQLGLRGTRAIAFERVVRERSERAVWCGLGASFAVLPLGYTYARAQP